MEEAVLHTWKKIKQEVSDPITAAILAIGCLMLTNATRKTGLTTSDAAKFLGVCPATIRDLCNKGEIKRHRFGKRSVRYTVEDLEAFQRRQTPMPDAHEDSHLSHFNQHPVTKKSCSKKKQPLVSS